MKSSALFERGPLPPYVRLVSTRRHSPDRCSQAYPVFRALPVPCKTEEQKKTGEAWERGYDTTVCLHSLVFTSITNGAGTIPPQWAYNHFSRSCGSGYNFVQYIESATSTVSGRSY